MFNIGIGLALNGEAEFKKGIREVNNELKVLRSEAKLVKETYAGNENSLEALTKKQELLQKQLEENNKKLQLNQQQLESWREVHDRAREKAEELRKQIEKETEQFNQMKESSSATAEEIENQENKIAALNAELKNAENSYERAGQKITGYQTGVNNTQATIEQLDRELKKNGDYLDEAKDATDGCAKSIDRYGREVREAAGESEEFGRTASQAVDNLAVALQGAGIVAGVNEIKNELLECADAATRFETTTAKLSTIAEGAGVSLEKLRAESLEASSDMATFAGNITEAAYDAISAGVNVEKSVYAASTATELAKAGFTNTNDALSVLTTTVNAYKMEVDDMTQISDSLIVTQNRGVLTVDQLAQSMGKGIASASAYNVDLYNLEAGYISLTKNGIACAESTTYMSAMFKELGDAESDVAEIITNKTGYSFGQLMGQGYSLADVLDILYDSVNGDAEALMNLWGSAEAGKASNAIVSQGLETFNDNLVAVQNSAGATAEAFEKMADTTEFAEERMNVAAENLKIAIGTQLNESLEEVYETGADILDAVTEFVNENPEIVAAIGGLVVGVGAAAAGVAAWTAAQKILNTVLMQNPYALVVVGIAGVTSAIGGLIAAMEKEKSWAEQIIEAENEKQEAIQQTITALEDSTEARDAARESEERELALASELTGELVELQKKEALSNEEKRRASMLVQELNGIMPELNLAIDEQGRVIGYTADELERYCEKSLSALELQFMQEDLTEVAKEHYEAEKQLYEIQNNRMELQEQLAEATEKYNEYLKDHTYTDEYGNEYLMLDGAGDLNEYAQAIEALESEIADYNNQERETQDIITDLNGQYAELTGAIMDTEEAYSSMNENVSAVQRSVIEYKGQHYAVTQDVVSNLESMSEKYYEARAAAMESIQEQVGLFEELSTQSDLTAEQMAENLESQTEFYNQYTENLNAAMQIMSENTDYATQDVLNSIIAMGVDGAGYLDELINAYESGGEEFNNVMTEYMEMTSAKRAVESAMADIETSYTESNERMIELAKENGEAMQMTTYEYSEAMRAEYSVKAGEIIAETENAMTSVNTTISNASPEATKVAGALGNSIIAAFDTALQIDDEGNSYMFVSSAGAITKGIATGIEHGKEEIAQAMQIAIDYAANNIDSTAVSGALIGVVNQTLGAKLK